MVEQWSNFKDFLLYLKNKPRLLILEIGFLTFFVGKIQKIIASLQDSPGGNFTNVDSLHTRHKLDSFTPMQQCSIMQLLKKSGSTTCGLDPLPTMLLKKCSDELSPVITQIVNLSLQAGCFPNLLKHAQVSPLLKADRLDPAKKITGHMPN